MPPGYGFHKVSPLTPCAVPILLKTTWTFALRRILSALFGRPYVGKELNTEVHLIGNPSLQTFFQGGQPKANLYLWVVSTSPQLTPCRWCRQSPYRTSQELNSKTEGLTGTEGSNPLRSAKQSAQT